MLSSLIYINVFTSSVVKLVSLQGFVEEFGECVDVDECADDNPCGDEGECVNQVGSYECMCQPGYRLVLITRIYNLYFVKCPMDFIETQSIPYSSRNLHNEMQRILAIFHINLVIFVAKTSITFIYLYISLVCLI